MKRKRTASENEGDYVKVGDLLFAKLTAEKRWMYSVIFEQETKVSGKCCKHIIGLTRRVLYIMNE